MKSKSVTDTLFLPKSNETYGWESFCELCSCLDENTEMKEFFELILTTEEKFALSMRYQLIKELLVGELSQRDIAKKLNVSISKITRGSNQLKLHSAEFKKNLLSNMLNIKTN